MYVRFSSQKNIHANFFCQTKQTQHEMKPAGRAGTDINRRPRPGSVALRVPPVLIYAPAIVSGAPDAGRPATLVRAGIYAVLPGAGSRLAAKLACSLCA